MHEARGSSARKTTALAVLAATIVGCHHVGPPNGADGGANGADSDTEDDGWTGDPGHTCSGKPSSCGDIADTAGGQEVGCCHDNTAYWCDDGDLKSESCGGLTCLYDPITNWVGCS